MGEIWDKFWIWAIVFVAVLIIIVFALSALLKSKAVQGLLSKCKVIELGKNGIKLESREGSDTAKDQQQDNALNEIKNELVNINRRIDGLDSGIQSLSSIVLANEELLQKTSEGTLENILFDEKRSTFLRLKSFRRLLAMKRNGRVWSTGFNLIRNNKDTWLDLTDNTELGIEIKDKEYYEARLDEIRIRIFDNFSKK